MRMNPDKAKNLCLRIKEVLTKGSPTSLKIEMPPLQENNRKKKRDDKSHCV
jgi:hypothetical protein